LPRFTIPLLSNEARNESFSIRTPTVLGRRSVTEPSPILTLARASRVHSPPKSSVVSPTPPSKSMRWVRALARPVTTRLAAPASMRTARAAARLGRSKLTRVSLAPVEMSSSSSASPPSFTSASPAPKASFSAIGTAGVRAMSARPSPRRSSRLLRPLRLATPSRSRPVARSYEETGETARSS
jgi:hypothetical protein